MKLSRGLPSLRQQATHAVLLATIASMREDAGESFRLVQYSVQSNHLHFICEAVDRETLTRSLQSLAIRIAKRLNALWKRTGKLFADRYHDRILRTPREVRNALTYVLHNAAKHGVAPMCVDPYSSARWFEGWDRASNTREPPPNPLARAKTWLLSVGWLRHGRIAIELGEIPTSAIDGSSSGSGSLSSRRRARGRT
jgi:REP element-mobilizing transposase RayT